MKRARKLLLSFFVLFPVLLDASGLYVSNNQLIPGTNVQTISLILSNVLSANDAGVNWIRLVKPSSFHFGPGPIHTNILVRTYYNGTTLTNLASTNWSTNWAFVSNEVMVSTNGTNDLILVLGNQVTNNASANREHVWIELNAVLSNEFSAEAFTAWVDAVQYEFMPAGKKNRYSTTGPALSGTSPLVYRKQGPADAFSAIIPNAINQGSFPFTFTFYLQAKTNVNQDAIRYAAIRVPREFSNLSAFTNFDSILLGTNEAATIRLTNAIPGLTNGGLSNYITIDYSSSPIVSGGLDVLSFKYFADPDLGTNLVWQTLVDYSPISTNSLAAATNANYPSQTITIGPPNLISPWDYQIIQSLNIAPVVAGISNLIPMSLVDIIADGEGAGEVITNINVKVMGASADAMGEIRLYRDLTNNSRLDTGSDSFVTNSFFSGSASVNLRFTDSNQSLSNIAPTRYWVALFLTNNTAGLFTNTIALRVSNIMVQGPNSGVVDSLSALGTPGNKLSRIDNLRIHAEASTLTNTNAVVRVKQGSFDNLAFRLVLSNTDIDATNFFAGIAVSNEGTANDVDLGFFKLFQDDGDGVFSVPDTLIFAGSMGSNSSYRLQTAVPPSLSGTNLHIFWGTYDVKYGARIGRTVRLKYLTGTNTLWSDTYNTLDYTTDQSDPRPIVTSAASALPTSNASQVITPSSAQTYDFSLSAVNYLGLPATFTTNQMVPVAAFALNMDTENTNGGEYSNLALTAQRFQGVDVRLASTGALTGVSGLAYLYRDANTNGLFGTNDTLVASNGVTSGASFSITNFFLSNVAVVFNQNPENFFLVFKLTNDINLAKTNKLSFQITNLQTSGPDGGVVSGLDLLSNAQSAEVRIDSPEVVINYISNHLIPQQAPQTSVKNKYLKISLRGNDPDASHALSHIDISTNGLTTVNVAADHINQVALENPAGDFLGLGKITNGSLRISLYSPEILSGTNESIFYLTYNVTILAAVGSNIGFTITNGSFGFSDPLPADGFPQSSFASGATSGPAAASNATIVSFNYTVWDFNVIGNANAAPPSLGVSNLYLMSYFDLRADEESPANEILTNVGVKISGMAPNLMGEVRLYRDTNNISSFDTNNDLFVTNAFFTAGQTSLNLNFSGQNNLNTLSSTPDQHTRFYLALRLTNAGAGVFTNTVGIFATNLAGIYGSSAAVFTNFDQLTNIGNQTSRVDLFQVRSYVASNTAQDVKQGSFNNLVFKLILSNQDNDSSNYFSGLVVTNAGNAQSTDLGFFRLYRDSGNGTFEATNDSLVMLATMANNQFVLTANPAVAMGGGETIFWGAVDIDLAAVTNRRVSLFIPQISGNFSFNDQITESSFASYDQRPIVTTTGPYPLVLNSNAIASFDVQPYDFVLSGVSYGIRPAAFTTNQRVPLASFDLYRDSDVNPIVLTNVAVAVLSTGVKSAVNGFAYLYKETNASGAFDLGDQLLGSNAVTAGADFSISVAHSNTTLNASSADRFYLAFDLTNSLALSMTNRFAFQVTNLRGLGQDGGGGAALFTNTSYLTNSPTGETRIDSHRIVIQTITNFIDSFSPKQYDQNHAYLRLLLAGEDPDATNFLSFLDVMTNSLSLISNDTIALVKLYTNTNAGGSLGSPIASAVFDAGLARLSPASPIALSGTNAVNLFIGYDVGSSSNVIGKKLGLLITNGGIGFSDQISDSFPQIAYASGQTSGPSPATNVQIYSFNSQPWDFTLQQSRSLAPVSIGVSNLYLMNSFDLMQDQESPDTQFLTNAEILMLGNAPNVMGEIRLYRDTSDLLTFDSNVDTLVATHPFVSAAGSKHIAFSNSTLAVFGIATDPSRYWVALRITNAAAPVFSNQVRLVVTNLMATGPNGGVIQNAPVLYNVTNSLSRVDDFRIFAFGATNTNQFVKQGSVDNFAFKLVLSNADPDSTNFLNLVTITNAGTAFTNDLSIFKLYQDNGDGLFDKATDPLLGSSGLTVSSQYVITLSPFAMGAGSNVFWGSYDVSLGASTNKTVILSVVASGLGFSDQYADSTFAAYDQRPVLQSAGPFPAANLISRITFADAQAYDFYVNAVNYTMPSSFTTNQQVQVGYADLFQDLDVDPLTLTNMQVLVTGPASQALGLAHVYRTVAGAGFSTNQLVGTALVNGASFTIPITTSNLALRTPVPPAATRFYLAFTLTNQIDLAKTNALSFQITNFAVTHSGLPGILADVSSLLAGSSSALTPIDSPKINLYLITNDLIFGNGDYSPKNNGRNNAYLRLSVGGDDPDSTNYLSAMDVVTNSLANLASNTVTTVRVYSNKGAYDDITGYFSESDLLGSAGFSTGTAHINFGANRLMLIGTNRYDLYVAYTVGTTTSNIGKSIGLHITNNSLVFDDRYPLDGFAQNSFISGVTSGPATATNTVVISSFVQPWDISLQSVLSVSPAGVLANVEVPVLALDLYRDNETGAESISSLDLSAQLTNKSFRGKVSVYYAFNASGYSDFGSGLLLASNLFISHTNSGLSISLTNPALNILPNFSRLYVTFTPTDFDLDAVVQLQITNVTAVGPNGGQVASLLPLTNFTQFKLDDNSVSASVETALPATLKQGTENAQAFKIFLRPNDPDATITLQKLSFTLSNTLAEDQYLKGTLYRESGDSPGFDEKDTAVSGGVTFSKGLAKINLNNSVALGSSGLTVYLLVGVTSGATPGNKFTLYFPREIQSDSFTPYILQGTSYPVTLSAYATNHTAECEILRWLEFGDEMVKIASTLINTCEGRGTKIYIKDVTKTGKLTVVVYDMLGYKIREIPVSGDTVEWKGTMGAGQFVPSGMYQILVIGDNVNKRFRVMVKQCQ